MDVREKLLMTPLIIMTILLGIYPALILDLIGPSVNALLEQVHAAQGVVSDASSKVTH